MASFAAEVKNELAHLMYAKECCRRAEAAGFLRMSAVMTLGGARGPGLTFTTENAAAARKMLVLMKEIAPVQTEVTVGRHRRLKKNNRYRIRVMPGAEVSQLLKALGLAPEAAPRASGGALLRRSCCRAAYLRGVFLAGGSVNRPEAAYHLELVAENYQLAELLQSLLRRLKLPAGITDRKDAYIVYLKEGDAIVELLSLMQAEAAVEAFEVARNVKEVRNQVNRLVNCETANINKAADAAARHIAAIERLRDGGRLAALPEPLRQTAAMRLAHPDATLAELGALLGLGRSGVNHRLRRIAQIAGEEKGEEN